MHSISFLPARSNASCTYRHFLRWNFLRFKGGGAGLTLLAVGPYVAQDRAGLALSGFARAEEREQPLIGGAQEFDAGEAAQGDIDGQQQGCNGEEPEGDGERGVDRRQIGHEGGSIVAGIKKASAASLR